jgi:2-polyprenyl-3-methyl-5-hydroxy-6-metoxy-1,4-benzoquinol methylase
MHQCKSCKSGDTIVIDTLKYNCLHCNNCKNLFFIPKNKKTIFNYISLILKLINKLLRINYLDKILCYQEETAEEAYLYYKSIIENQKYENTKWWEYDLKFLDYLKKNNIDLTNKKILSISEEPGFIFKKIKEISSKVLFTALNDEVSQIMKKHIGVNTITYNANTNDISEIIKEKYDIILMRWVLGHVDDLKKFTYEIEKITSKETIIFCNFQSPSLQLSVIFGYDNYTFSALYDEDYVKNIFEEKGFEIIKKDKQEEDIVDKYYNGFLKKLLFLPLYSYYYTKFNIKKKFTKKNFEIPIKETKFSFILKKK